MKYNAFQQIPERQILQLGYGFQDLEEALLHTNASLYAFHFHFLPASKAGMTPLPYGRGSYVRNSLVGQQKGVPGKIGGEGFGAVVFLQNVVLPVQEVWISVGKVRPTLVAARPGHPLADQEQKCPCDRLVVKRRLAVCRSELEQRGGKALQGLQDRVSAQVQKRHSHVVRVMKRQIVQSGIFKTRHKLVIGHRQGSFLSMYYCTNVPKARGL